MASLEEIEKHVLDDAVELIRAVGVTNPLVGSTILMQMTEEDRKAPDLIRAVLSRHVVLLLTRLHERDGTGRTGETASIASYLRHASAAAHIDETSLKQLNDKRLEIVRKLEGQNIRYDELVEFRHTELAHSLQPHKPVRNSFPHLPVWDMAFDTFELVLEIETRVSTSLGRRSRNLKGMFHEWMDVGRQFWRRFGDID